MNWLQKISNWWQTNPTLDSDQQLDKLFRVVFPHTDEPYKADPSEVTYWDSDPHQAIDESIYGTKPGERHPRTHHYTRYFFMYQNWIYILRCYYYEARDQTGKMLMLEGYLYCIEDENKYRENKGEGVSVVGKVGGLGAKDPYQFAEQVKAAIINDWDGGDDDDDEEEDPEPWIDPVVRDEMEEDESVEYAYAPGRGIR